MTVLYNIHKYAAFSELVKSELQHFTCIGWKRTEMVGSWFSIWICKKMQNRENDQLKWNCTSLWRKKNVQLLYLRLLYLDVTDKKMFVISLHPKHNWIAAMLLREYSSYLLHNVQRMRFKWANGSWFAFGATDFATSGVPKTFQNLKVSSPAADATVHPSGLWIGKTIKSE